MEENQSLEEYVISSLINLHCFVIIHVCSMHGCICISGNMLFLQHFNWSHDQIGFNYNYSHMLLREIILFKLSVISTQVWLTHIHVCQYFCPIINMKLL